MTQDYIADQLHEIRSHRIPVRAPNYRASPLSTIAGEVRDRASDLDGRELYAFDLSALNAAADLRIDTPDRVDRLVSAVLETPRRLFIEASAADMTVINRNLRGLLSPWQEVGDDRLRWGAFIDIHGNGRASYQSVTMVPADAFKADASYAPLLAEAKTFEGSLYSLASQSLRLRLAPVVGNIDISRHVGMSKKEFEDAFSRIVSSSDPIARHAAALLDKEKSSRKRGKIIEEAWRAMRFRDILRTQPAAGTVDAMAPGYSSLEALRVGLPIIAMLAVLSADADDLKAVPRERPKRDRKAPSSPRKKRDLAPGLRVVTLNLEDREMQRLYESHNAAGEAEHGAPVETGGARVRHPVRGHLFLARNGRMTWRKPHWRGTLERPVLRRVTAPSHKK